ncbi:MAG: aldo/keto reductase [Aureispira sp.]|nr:aldo/keto reductase [Aureispira sp.]
MQNLTLNTGSQLPALGLGTWKSKPGEVYQAILQAIQIGYRHFDCAAIYGNESEIGQAFQEAFQKGWVTRQELWITSKLWCNAHHAENVQTALQKTLNDLSLDYLDLYLIHWPVVLQPTSMFAAKASDLIPLKEVPTIETWQALESCVQAGLSKNIGVSNFSVNKLSELLAQTSTTPAMNQIELHPLLQQKEMLDYCKTVGVQLTAYSPLGSKDRAAALRSANEPSLLENTTILDIASTHNCTAAQVLIKWALQRGTAVIPKSVNPKRLKENFEAQELTLSSQAMQEISTLDKHFRFVNGAFWAVEGSDYTVAKLWDE